MAINNRGARKHPDNKKKQIAVLLLLQTYFICLETTGLFNFQHIDTCR